MDRYDSRVLKYSGAKVSLGVSDERGCDASVGEDEEKREKKVEEDKLCDAKHGEAGCGRAEPRSRRGTLGLGRLCDPRPMARRVATAQGGSTWV